MQTTGSRWVLVVDDDEATRMTFLDALSLEGYEVVTCSTAADALLELELHPFYGAVLLDWKMPNRSGQWFLEEKARRPAIAGLPVVVSTAWKLTEVPAGACALLPKPFGLDDLFDLVARLCGRRPALGLAG